MRGVLRVGFILLGAFLIAEAIVSLGDSFGRLLMASRLLGALGSGEQADSSHGLSAAAASVSIAKALLFGAAPGLLVIARSESWAHRLLPNVGDDHLSTGAPLLRVGLVVLGVFFTIQGAAGLAGGVAAQAAWQFNELNVSPSAILGYPLGYAVLVSSLTKLAAGLLILAWGHRAARNAA